jgi:serine protease Do
MKLILAIALAGLLGIALAIIFFLPEQGPVVDSGGVSGSAAGPEGGQGGEIGRVSGAATSQAAGGSGSTDPGADASGGPSYQPPAMPEGISNSRRTAIVVAAEKTGPAVVSISVMQTRVVQSRRSPFGDPFFDQFFRERRHLEQIPSLGSGVIISSDGLVVTNEHVVREATEIKVTLTDGRQFEGEVIASQRDYDIALVRIDGDHLPVAELGDSDGLIIGEWAIAIGNPFGYLLQDTHPSVTAGVISALHRSVLTSEEVIGVYKDMIQTDAAINPGNSGGPLVNSIGQVIGINTFIISQSGGSLGIGFAIPVNRVKYIMDEVKTYGRIREIWIGLGVQELTPMLAHSIGLEISRGVLISQVDEGSPADKAGLKRRDVIVELNGQRVRNYDGARRAIFGAGIGDVLVFKVLRDGDEHVMRVQVEEAPAEDETQ